MTDAGQKLHTAWTLYYHSPEDKDWSPSSYTSVGTVRTLGEFWQLHTALPCAAAYPS